MTKVTCERHLAFTISVEIDEVIKCQILDGVMHESQDKKENTISFISYRIHIQKNKCRYEIETMKKYKNVM